MAGRILPVALATISGIAIGMATFGEELKTQRMKRLTEEYERNVAAAAAAASSENPAAIAPPTTTVTSPPPPPAPALAQLPVKEETKPTTSTWSDALGFWAWKQKPRQDSVPTSLAAPAVAQEAPTKGVSEELVKKP